MLASPTDIPSLRPPPREEWHPKAHYRSLFGQSMLWHSVKDGGRHLDTMQLEPYRSVGDVPVDDILQAMYDEGSPLQPNQDVLDLVDNPSISIATRRRIEAFSRKFSNLPNWVDIHQLSRGQEVFLAYAPILGATLYYRSLVPGFSISKIAPVLQATAYLAPPSSREAVQERLLDTGAFIGLSMGFSVESILPGGDGWKSAISVRVLHAKVRRALLERKGSRRWDVQALGIPINQEDLAATLLAFSVNALVGCELVLGFAISEQERRDYIALWRYLGWLLGVDTDSVVQGSQTLRPLDPCGPGWIAREPDSLKHSYAIFESILHHLMTPNEDSIAVAHHLLHIGRRKGGGRKGTVATKEEKNNFGWFTFRCLQCRRMIGNPLADALRLPLHPTWRMQLFQWGASYLYFWLLGIYTLAGLPWSPIRTYLVNFHRRKMQEFVSSWKHRMKERPSFESSCPFAMVFVPT